MSKEYANHAVQHTLAQNTRITVPHVLQKSNQTLLLTEYAKIVVQHFPVAQGLCVALSAGIWPEDPIYKNLQSVLSAVRITANDVAKNMLSKVEDRNIVRIASEMHPSNGSGITRQGIAKIRKFKFENRKNEKTNRRYANTVKGLSKPIRQQSTVLNIVKKSKQN